MSDSNAPAAFLAAISILAVGLFLGSLFGFDVSRQSNLRDCDTLGQFRHGDVVYECRRKPAAQGVVR